MKVKGREKAEWSEDPVLKEEKVDETWLDKLNLDGLKIPIVGRPKGGTRVDFFVYSNLPDLALSIKEEDILRFKNSNDVHRAAHYIGMQIMKRLFVKGKLKHDDVHKLFEDEVVRGEKIFVKRAIRDTCKKAFDNYNEGMISAESLNGLFEGIVKRITDPELREWAKKDIEGLVNNEAEFLRSKARVTSRMHREKAKELKLERLEGGKVVE